MKMLLFLLIALAAGSGSCASFRGDKAASQTEKLICRDRALSRLDEDMAASFKKQLAAVDGVYQKDALNQTKELATIRSQSLRRCQLSSTSLPNEEPADCCMFHELRRPR